MYENDLAAYNAICVAKDGVGGHDHDVSAINELVSLAGGSLTYLSTVSALNALSVLLGGSGGHELTITALERWIRVQYRGAERVGGCTRGYPRVKKTRPILRR